MPKPCLHCDLRDAIGEHFEALGDVHGDEVVIDSHKVLAALAQLAAEILASEPEAEMRSALFEALTSVIIETVTEIRLAGRQAPQFVLS